MSVNLHRAYRFNCKRLHEVTIHVVAHSGLERPKKELKDPVVNLRKD